MRRRGLRLGRGPAAALSILLGALTGVAINLATDSPGWAIVTGLVLVVSLWAGLEWWRASATKAEPGAIRVAQQAERVRGGEVVGAEGKPEGAGLEVDQRVTEVGRDGRVIGYREPGQ